VTAPNLAPNSGHAIPQLGFGVFKIAPAETAAAVSEALRVGYRHIDTAEMYRNEKEVGEALGTSGLDRGDVFITSKLNNGFHRPDDARRAFDGTLEALGSDYVDLFFIHWPLPALYGGDFDRDDRRSSGTDACAGGASVAHSTRGRHLSQIDDTSTDQGELRDLRLRARAR
jgi:diketogulonate reductase-like aldo/keto reductase